MLPNGMEQGFTHLPAGLPVRIGCQCHVQPRLCLECGARRPLQWQTLLGGDGFRIRMAGRLVRLAAQNRLAHRPILYLPRQIRQHLRQLMKGNIGARR